MGARCDYRAAARSCGQTAREVELVEELLKGSLVATYTSPYSSRTIVGMAGLRFDSWDGLYARLRNAGLLFDTDDSNGRITYRMHIPAQ